MPSIHNYGLVYTNKNLTQFTILVYPEDEQVLWSDSVQMMITAPALNREEAVELSNKIMEEYELRNK
ncbi:hypothetical protein [Ornithinibacillus californiensis]|uniref:hypothetical protein n=1 Tax=Ornithinibacillus californiensis TaxID=161536 RepID=UPI00064DDE9C|nr:hypothetical protein [Ornithinibacillus californiensis]